LVSATNAAYESGGDRKLFYRMGKFDGSVITMTIARDNIDALTGLRFIAAFTIVLGHSYQPWLEITGIGMPLFFTLSGFIIHYVYRDTFAAGWRRAAAEFAVARFSRIYPLYAAFLFYFLISSPMGPALMHPSEFPVLLSYIFGYWTWWPLTADGDALLDWYYHISWSVPTEIFFYICYALFLYRIARIRSARRCLVTLIAFCGASYFLFYCLFQTRDVWEGYFLARFPQFTSRTTNFDASFYRWLLYGSPYCRIFEFVGGCLTCQFFLLTRGKRSLLDRVHPGTIAWLGIVVMVVLFILFRYYGEYNPWLALGNHSIPGYLVSLHMNFLFAPACYLLIFALAVGGSGIGRLLSSKPCRLLGDISYSTYLSHPMADRILLHAGIIISSAALHVIVIMAIVYPMSWILFTIVEVPAKRVLRQILDAWLLSGPVFSRGT
jgi:peptidoglycan/LPS O-acetylase OafA/YrhL